MSGSGSSDHAKEAESTEFITVVISGQLFGIPINLAQDVFKIDRMTEIPLSPPDIAGVLNLRGRIVTAIDMHHRLQMDSPTAEGGVKRMAVGVEYNGESYGIIIDEVGDVLRLNRDNMQPNPSNLDPRWSDVAGGIYQLTRELMVVLDVDKVLSSIEERSKNAA
jgi:purine-binding chemotaxis protein CheW